MITKEQILQNIEAGIKVMLVDDEEKILRSLKRIFRKELFPFEFFSDPLEALERVRAGEDYAVILSDNMMPNLSGIDLMKEFSVLLPLSTRILLTGATTSVDAIDAFNNGIIHYYLEKPWDNEKLLTYFHNALEQYRQNKFNHFSGQLKDTVMKKQSELYTKTVTHLKQTQTQLEISKSLVSKKRLIVSPAFTQLSILIVDENPDVGEILVKALKQNGVEHCFATTSAKGALKYLKLKDNVDLILSDWKTTDMTWQKFLKCVRSHLELKKQPRFLLATTRENKESVRLALSSGIDGYIIKPFNMEVLVEHIEELIKKKDQPKKEQEQKNQHPFLIVCEDYSFSSTLRNILHLCGYGNIVLTNSGKNALYTLEQKEIKTIFYHYEMDGPRWQNLYQAMTERKIATEGKSLIVMSSLKIPEKALKNYDEKLPTGYLNRPFDRQKIVTIFKELGIWQDSTSQNVTLPENGQDE